jgi:general secretion pathway protein J
MSCPHLEQRAGGYTLIEVLVALAVLSVVVTTTLGGLVLGARSRDAIRIQGERLAQLQTALVLYEQDLLHALYRPVHTARGEQPAFVYFPGIARPRLVFTTVEAAGTGEDALARTVRVEWFAKEGTLVRRQWLFADRTALTPSVDTAVLSGVRRYRVQFLDSARQWHSRWPSPQAPKDRDGLPTAVRLDLDLEDWGEIERLFVLRAP